MRIGLNTLFLIPNKMGGTEIYARSLISGFAQVDNKNEYFILSNKENYKTWSKLPPNFKPIYCNVKGSNKIFRTLYEQILLNKVIKENKLDIVHSLGYTIPLTHKGYISVVTIGDLIFEIFPKEFSFIQKLAAKKLIFSAAKKSDYIVTFSEYAKQDIVKFCSVPQDKISAILLAPNKFLAFESDPVKKARIIKNIKEKYHIKSNYVLSVVSTYYHKNLHRLLDAFKILRGKYKIAHQLVLTGLSMRANKEVINYVEQLGLKDAVIFTGWVEEEEIAHLYQAAALFVFPSLYEGFGLPVLEAMAAGVPVVSSNATSLPEVLGNAAITFVPYNVEEMVKKIVEVLVSENLQKELIEKGKKQVMKFSWEKCAHETLDVYEKLLFDKNFYKSTR